MSMRIVWGSPWNERSSIAKFGGEVVDELLARGHRVEVLRTEVGPATMLPARPTSARVRFWKDIPAQEFSRNADVVIGNFGNHYPFHGALLQNFTELGIVGIFHDSVLSHLAEGWAHTLPDPEATLRRLVVATYGASAWGEGEPFVPDVETAARKRPMLEWFASGVSGAVVHAQHYAAAVRKVCPGPVAVIPMAFEFADLPPPRPASGQQLVVATIGMGNANKRMGQVLQAIAASPRLRERCRFRAIGESDPEEREYLRQLCATLGMPVLESTGWVSDNKLREQLRDVDVLACLRYPVLEGASGSLLLSMLSGRPVLVSAHGVYAEIPDGLLLRCKAGDETVDVARHLEWVLDNRDAARTLGKRAREYALQTNTAQRYVDALLSLLDAAIAARPMMLTGQALGKTLASFHIDPSDPAIARVGTALGSLLGE